jgi:threonylcarbamoyladenosine tRNA methylthiotransferase MtaB
MIQEILKNYPIEVVPFDDKADLYIINTCAVTNNSEANSRQIIRKAKKRNPNAEILVTGCYVQADEVSVKNMKEVNFTFNNIKKDYIPEFIRKSYFPNVPKVNEKNIFVKSFENQTRPFIKIQDGCKSDCSYCIIPRTRPVMKSVAKEDIVKQINILSDLGYKEIVLTGIHLGYYGIGLKEKLTFNDLLIYLDNNTTIERIRISSIDPHEVTKDFVDIVSASKKIANHLHIALQYGDNKILSDMNRDYFVEDLLNNLEYANKKIKNLVYGFDVIVGFPTETEDTFKNTLNLIKRTKPGYLHVFPYSVRPFTKAADSYKKQINGSLIKSRAKILRELGKELKLENMQNSIGNIETVLIERVYQGNGIDYFRGHTGNYFDVIMEKSSSLSDNIMVKVKIKDIYNDNLMLAVPI